MHKQHNMQKHNPDDRSDNVERIQENINNTIENINLTEEMISKTDNREVIEQLEAKNDRRREALSGMRVEIRDEAIDRRKKRYNRHK